MTGIGYLLQGWLLDGSENGSSVSMYGIASGEAEAAHPCVYRFAAHRNDGAYAERIRLEHISGLCKPCRRGRELGPLYWKQCCFPHIRFHITDVQVGAMFCLSTQMQRAIQPFVQFAIPDLKTEGVPPHEVLCNCLCRCINETDGLFLSAPINATMNPAYFCNRYKIINDGTQVRLHLCSACLAAVYVINVCVHSLLMYTSTYNIPFIGLWPALGQAAGSCWMQVLVVANFQVGSYPECPDAIVEMADLNMAPTALVQSAGTFNVIGQTQLPECPAAHPG